MSLTSRKPWGSHRQMETMSPQSDEWKECWFAMGNSQLSATFHSSWTSTLCWWKGERQPVRSLLGKYYTSFKPLSCSWYQPSVYVMIRNDNENNDNQPPADMLHKSSAMFPRVRWRRLKSKSDTVSGLKGSTEATLSDLLKGTLQLRDKWGEDGRFVQGPKGQ